MVRRGQTCEAPASHVSSHLGWRHESPKLTRNLEARLKSPTRHPMDLQCPEHPAGHLRTSPAKSTFQTNELHTGDAARRQTTAGRLASRKTNKASHLLRTDSPPEYGHQRNGSKRPGHSAKSADMQAAVCEFRRHVPKRVPTPRPAALLHLQSMLHEVEVAFGTEVLHHCHCCIHTTATATVSSTANASPDEPCSRVFKPYCVCPNIGHGHGQPKASDRFFLPFNGCGQILEASSETREPPASTGHGTHVNNMYAADDGAHSSFPAGVNMFRKQARIREACRGQVLRVRVRVHGTRARMTHTHTNRCELGSRVKRPKESSAMVVSLGGCD